MFQIFSSINHTNERNNRRRKKTLLAGFQFLKTPRARFRQRNIKFVFNTSILQNFNRLIGLAIKRCNKQNNFLKTIWKMSVISTGRRELRGDPEEGPIGVEERRL